MYLEAASKEQLQNIYACYNTDEEFLKNAAKCLKEWLEKQPHLPNVSDEEFLINVMLRNKNNIERARQFLEQYYMYRATMDVYSKRDVFSDHVLRTLKVLSIIMLPKVTPDGCRIWVWRFPVDGIKYFQPSEESLFELTTIALDICLKADRTKSGILIVDWKNIPASMATLMLLVGRKLTKLSTKIMRNPCQKVIALNLSPTLIPAFNLAKSLVKKKIADRAQIWTKNPSELSQILPKSILPAEFGGELESLDKLAEMTIEYFKEFREWILQEREVKADLTKKKGHRAKCENTGVFGLNGCFRKIEID